MKNLSKNYAVNKKITLQCDLIAHESDNNQPCVSLYRNGMLASNVTQFKSIQFNFGIDSFSYLIFLASMQGRKSMAKAIRLAFEECFVLNDKYHVFTV